MNELEKSQRVKYDGNPVKFLFRARKGLMAEWLLRLWIVLSIILLMLDIIGFIDFTKIHIGDLLDSSIAGLSFSLIVVSAALDVFKREELKVLYNHKDNSVDADGLLLMKVLAPYVFTSMLFLILGISSVIAPLLNVQLPDTLSFIIKYLYTVILVLGLFSLFNICYDIIINIFNSVRRDSVEGNHVEK